jgi:hypothetical protein
MENFIKRAVEIHGNKYDYSKAIYKNLYTKVCIVCPKHGEFWQTPNAHIIRKQGCKLCSNEEIANKFKKSTEQFIAEAHKVHGDKYDYSKVEYVNNKTKVCIICHEHGEFWQTPSKHILGQECPKCTVKHKNNQPKNTEQFIAEARKVHGDKYDYSKVEYVNDRTKVCIICPGHGEF